MEKKIKLLGLLAFIFLNCFGQKTENHLLKNKIDTIYILIPSNYNIDEETIEGFKKNYQFHIDYNSYVGWTKNYILYSVFCSWHNKPNERYFGLILNNNITATNEQINRLSLLKKNVRPLIFYYDILQRIEFRKKNHAGKYVFYAIKESDFKDETQTNINFYSVEVFIHNSME
jgi:hypothetical protein